MDSLDWVEFAGELASKEDEWVIVMNTTLNYFELFGNDNDACFVNSIDSAFIFNNKLEAQVACDRLNLMGGEKCTVFSVRGQAQ